MSLSILVLPAALISWVRAFRRASRWRESALRSDRQATESHTRLLEFLLAACVA